MDLNAYEMIDKIDEEYQLKSFVYELIKDCPEIVPHIREAYKEYFEEQYINEDEMKEIF